MSNNKWRFPNDIKMSINSALVPLSHSSSVTRTCFLSLTKNLWCCPYYIFFFIEHIFTRSISWIRFCFCFQISFFYCRSSAESQMRESQLPAVDSFPCGRVYPPRILSFSSQWDLIPVFKMYLWLYKCCAFHLKYILQKCYIWMENIISLEYIVYQKTYSSQIWFVSVMFYCFCNSYLLKYWCTVVQYPMYLELHIYIYIYKSYISKRTFFHTSFYIVNYLYFYFTLPYLYLSIHVLTYSSHKVTKLFQSEILPDISLLHGIWGFIGTVKLGSCIKLMLFVYVLHMFSHTIIHKMCNNYIPKVTLKGRWYFKYSNSEFGVSHTFICVTVFSCRTT